MRKIHTLRRAPIFLMQYFFIAAASIVILLLYSKTDIHLTINKYHCAFTDVFFRYGTHAGAGLTIIILSVLMVFIRYGYAVLSLSTYLLSSLIVQILKRLVFPDVVRPKLFFMGKADLYFVPGTDPNILQSFPSGHSATAFAFFLTLSIISGKKWLQGLFFICAMLVGFSRIYLSEHFLADVLAGSFIGVISTVILHELFVRNQKDWMKNRLKLTFKV